MFVPVMNVRVVQMQGRPEARAEQRERGQQDEGALTQGKLKDAVNHIGSMGQMSQTLHGHDEADDGQQDATRVGQPSRQRAKPSQPFCGVLHRERGEGADSDQRERKSDAEWTGMKLT